MQKVNEKQLQKLLDMFTELGIERAQFDNILQDEEFLELLQYYAATKVCDIRGHVEYSDSFDRQLASACISPPTKEIRKLHFVSTKEDRPGRGVTFPIFYYNRPISNEEVMQDLKKRRHVRPGTLDDLLAVSSCLTDENFPQKGNIVAPASRVDHPAYNMHPFLKYNHDTKKWELDVESFNISGPLKKQKANTLWSKDFYFLAVDQIRK